MKKISIVLVVAGVIILGIILAADKRDWSIAGVPSEIKIAASFYPLSEFAKKVGGGGTEIINIVPAGVEPHDFEPTPRDVARTNSAKIFIFNGNGIDPWAEKISPELERRGIISIHMTQKIEAEERDPHIWLDPVLAKKEVEIIRDAFKKVDPSNSAKYDFNANQYSGELLELDEKYRVGLASCEIRDVVASHEALGYLAKRYNFNVTTIAGLSPEEEPSPKKIAEIAEFAREKNIKYIFFETLVSPEISETIAGEIGAGTLVFNPSEGLTDEELAAGKNYISIMEENLTNLRQAMICA